MSSYTKNYGGVTVTVTDATDRILAALEKAKARGLFAIGEAAEGHAKDTILENERVDTGLMLNRTGHAETEDATYVGCNTDYAIYNELGTQYMTGIHFIQDAAAGHPKEFKDIMKDSLQNA